MRTRGSPSVRRLSGSTFRAVELRRSCGIASDLPVAVEETRTRFADLLQFTVSTGRRRYAKTPA